MTSFAFSVVLCVTVILNIWTAWSDHPVTVTLDDKTTAIAEIPFPSVTICTTQKIRDNLTKIKDNDGYEQLFPGE